jgi:hypothetical protein
MADRRPRSTGRNLLHYAVLLAVGPGLALALLEVGARWIERRRDSAGPKTQWSVRLMQPNPNKTGSYRMIPNLKATAWVRGAWVDLGTNSFGMRWREVTLAKRPGVKRIALLGDSFAYGSWADRWDKSFAAVLERELGPPFEVVNFGVSGYGFDDIELQLREEVLRFAPDYVLVASYNGNDFRDTGLGLDKFVIKDGNADFDEKVLDARIPGCYRQRVVRTSGPAPDPLTLRRWLKRTATGRLLLPLIGWEHPWLEFSVGPTFTASTFWSQRPWPDVALKAKDVSLTTLDRMRQTAEEHGARFAITCLPFREQVYALNSTGRDWDVAFPQAYVQMWARERSVPFFDLLPALREHVVATHDRLYLPGDPHFDNHGHAVVGHLLRRWFLRQVRTPDPQPACATQGSLARDPGYQPE